MGLSLGGNDNQILIEIITDASGAVSGIKTVEEAQESLEKSTVSLNKTTEEFGNQYIKVGGELGKAAGGLAIVGTAIAGLGAATLELANRGEVFGSLRDNFQNLGGASSVIDDVIDRTKGLVTQTEAYKLANEALVKGIPDVNKNFGDLAALGASLADALDKGVVETTNQITAGIARARPQLLAQLGIFIDTKKALQDYAAAKGKTVEQLNAFEKKLATQQALLTASKQKLQELGEITDSVANAQESYGNRLSDALDIVGAAINENPELTKTIRDMSDALADVDWEAFGSNLSKLLGDFLRGSGVVKNFAISVKDFYLEILNAIPLVTRLSEALSAIPGQFAAFKRGLSVYKELSTQAKEGGLASLSLSKAQEAVRKKLDASAAAAKAYAKAQEDADKKKVEAAKKEREALDRSRIATTNKTKADYESIDVSQIIANTVLKNQLIPQIENMTAAFNFGLAGADELKVGLEQLRKEFVKTTDDAKIFDSVVSSQNFGANVGKGKTAVEFPNLTLGEDYKRILEETEQTAQIIEEQLQAAFSTAFDGLINYIKTGESGFEGRYGEAIGGILGGAIAAYFSGGNPAATQLGGQIGSILGALLDKSLGKLGDKQAQTRKKIEEYVEDFLILYNNIVVDNAGKATPLTNLILGDKGKFEDDLDPLTQSFNEWLDETFKNNPQVTNAFTSVGAALAESLGAGFEQGEQVFASLLQQLGSTEDGFNNLKVIVLELGLTLEDSTEAMIELFKKGEIGALDAEGNIQSLNQVFAEGRVGVGDYIGAINDLIASGGTGVRAIKDLKDLAVEGQEAGIGSLEALKNELIKNGTLSVEQANALFGSIAQNGIKTLEQLTEVSDRAVISILAGAEASGFAFGEKFDELNQTLEETEQRVQSAQEAIAKIPEFQEKRINFVVTADVDSKARTISDAYFGQNGPGVAS